MQKTQERFSANGFRDAGHPGKISQVLQCFRGIQRTVGDNQGQTDTLTQLTQMRVQCLPETVLIVAVAAQRFHPQRYTRLMLANQLQYYLIEIRSVIAAITLRELNNAFRHIVLAAVVGAINMKAGTVQMADGTG